MVTPVEHRSIDVRDRAKSSVAAWLVLQALAGMLAVLASVLGHAAVSSWDEPLAGLASAAQTGATGDEAWAAVWRDQLPATLVGCVLLASGIGMARRALRRLGGEKLLTSAGAMTWAVTAFALFNVPPPGILLSVYSIVFLASVAVAAWFLEMVAGATGASISRIVAVWPLIVLGLLTSAAAAFGSLAGAAAQQLVGEGESKHPSWDG